MGEAILMWMAGGFCLILIGWRYLISYLGWRGFVGKVDRELKTILTSDEYKVKGKFE